MLNELIRYNESAINEAFTIALKRAKTESDDPAQLEQLIFNLAGNNMHLLEILADNSKMILECAGTVYKLLANAQRRAVTPEARVRIRLLATKLGFWPRLQKESRSQESFTQSQKDALKALHAIAELSQDNTHQFADIFRCMPLIVGPSGVGKTHTVRAFAEQLGRPMLRLAIGDWIVAGAAKFECTYQTLLKHLDEHGKIVLFIDELCKAGHNHENTAWSAAVITELFALLDRQISYSGTSELAWKPEHSLRLKRDVIIVGAATFQNVWNGLNAPKMGFASSPVTSASVVQAVRKAQVLPLEMLNRFMDQWLVIDPYTQADFARLTKQRKIPRRIVDPVKAAASGLNYRYLESAVTSDAVKKQIKIMAERDAQTVSRDVEAA
jgi:MoxR-like ATPase